MSNQPQGVSKGVNGIFTRVGPNRILACFVIDQKQFTCYATVSHNKPLPVFTSATATLTYWKLSDLTFSQPFKANITANSIAIDFDNPVKIEGTFDIMVMDSVGPITGLGAWEQN